MRLTPTRTSPPDTDQPRRAAPPLPMRLSLPARATITGLLCLAVLLLGSAAHAASAATSDTHVVALAGSVDAVLGNIRNWLMGILAALATVFLTIGGVRYVIAAGNPGEVEKAKTAFKSAGIGYALAALAPLVVTVLQGIVGS